MMYKYVLLKSSWGIVIFLDVEEIIDPEINDSDIEISNKIYLRISDTSQLDKEVIVKWIGLGIKDIKEIIYQKIHDRMVCFNVKNLDFNYVDFQEEGLYCAIQEWISKYYSIKIEPLEIAFDNIQNKYVFSFPTQPT